MTVRDVLLVSRGLVFVSSSSSSQSENHVRAVEIELAELGYVMSSRLHARLTGCSLDELAEFRTWASTVLLAHVGGDRKHEPLFRRFPHGIADDTDDLWWRKVLVHFLQADGQPCLFCRRIGTTQVLNPCRHVVCANCFDGANYSACPVCERHVDRSSPFFQPLPERGQPSEKVVFTLIDLGESLAADGKALFVSLAERRQALSPTDRDALLAIVREFRTEVLAWLPITIPVRENVAIVLGTLFSCCDAVDVLPYATRYLITATDVLRLVAVMSGTDGSLLPETVFKSAERLQSPHPIWRQITTLIGAAPPEPMLRSVTIPVRVRRFRVAKIPRALRRALLALLDGKDAQHLVEDMLRHRSYWIWLGEFLHPSEYASRYPNVARAFLILRQKAPDGTPAPPFIGWHARLEQLVNARDVPAMVRLLSERPGELARRFDHALRVAGSDRQSAMHVVNALAANVGALATPVLLALRSHLPTRTSPASVRVYWPKGRVAMGASSADRRASLSPDDIVPTIRTITRELLRRCASEPPFDECLIDEALARVVAPFNERTASPAAVSLPRGTRVPVGTAGYLRLFLHWCAPPRSGRETDLDLSVGFYDESWKYLGVCSYYQLKCTGHDGSIIAQSSGDLRDAPWPDGATEFVDIHRDQAARAGIRYAVMVVNNYAGQPFSLLERAFAGLMHRDDPGGRHFDPRTVQLKFSLSGENGVFLPLVLDIREQMVHWLDVHARGQFEMNNVETSKAAIAKICPDLITYFASGVRPSMLDLARLHAAARCRRVFIRGQGIELFIRRPDDDLETFHERLVRGEADERNVALPPTDQPLLAMLYRGNVVLHRGSAAYALFREQTIPSLAAADLIV